MITSNASYNIQMNTYVLGVVLGFLALGLLRWILEPYLVWKRAHVGRKLEGASITDRNMNKMSLQEFKKAQETKPQIKFSLVVPSYNEEKRITVMLQETLEFFKKTQYTYEILIVNDGSKDKTSQVALDFAKKNQINELYVVEYAKNRGKGGAIRVGMQLARGHYPLMVDADGATQFSELQKVYDKLLEEEKAVGSPFVMVVGSRHHLNEDQSVQLKRKWYRKLFAMVFHLILRHICGIKVNDTQCGFKLMTLETSKVLFDTLHVEKWAFDVELFVISNHFKIRYFEVPVNWEDVEGSKLSIFAASFSMLRDIFLVKVCYALHLWRYADKYRIV